MDMKEYAIKRSKVPSHTFVDYFFKPATTTKETWLLLHGYGESAFQIVKRLNPLFKNDVNILAPNAPFPLPTQTQSADKLGFGWYFYDRENDRYFIDFSIASEILNNLIIELKLDQTKLRIIGYSQGGYLAPFAGIALKNTFHVVGINSSTRVDFIEDKKLPFIFDQIHAENDEFVDPTLAKARFEQLQSYGNKGEIVFLPDETHFLSRNFLDPLNNLISKTSVQ